jgi:cyclophilin family peptidyl-prolyl cis-trans isomerase
MLSVYRTSELKSMKSDGILGLAPSTQRSASSVFIKELQKAGVIDKQMFSFYITKGDLSSRVIFGGYDLKYAANSDG